MYFRFGSFSLRRWSALVAAAAVAAAVTACGGPQETPAELTPAAAAETPEPSSATKPASANDDVLPPAVESQLPEGVRTLMDKPFTGDFDEMAKRRMIRAGVTYNRTFYFIDKGVTRGVAYEYGKLFEDELNKTLHTGNMRIHVVFVPMP